jgi:hypothetical protein
MSGAAIASAIAQGDGDEEEVESVRDWSRMPADMVRFCASLLDCNVDRMNMSAQCTAWRSALEEL